jgi:hypothetical protein
MYTNISFGQTKAWIREGYHYNFHKRVIKETGEREVACVITLYRHARVGSGGGGKMCRCASLLCGKGHFVDEVISERLNLKE